MLLWPQTAEEAHAMPDNKDLDAPCLLLASDASAHLADAVLPVAGGRFVSSL